MFVPVESEAQSLELLEAGLLWINTSAKWPRDESAWCGATTDYPVATYIAHAFHSCPSVTHYMPCDFAYYLED